MLRRGTSQRAMATGTWRQRQQVCLLGRGPAAAVKDRVWGRPAVRELGSGWPAFAYICASAGTACWASLHAAASCDSCTRCVWARGCCRRGGSGAGKRRERGRRSSKRRRSSLSPAGAGGIHGRYSAVLTPRPHAGSWGRTAQYSCLTPAVVDWVARQPRAAWVSQTNPLCCHMQTCVVACLCTCPPATAQLAANSCLAASSCDVFLCNLSL